MRVQPGTMQARRRRCAMQRQHRGSYRAIRLSPRQGQGLRAKEFRHVSVFPARGAGSAGDCEPVLSPSTVAVFLFSILNYSPSEREKCTLEKRTRPWSRPRHAGGAASSRPLCVAPTVSAAPNRHPTAPRVAAAWPPAPRTSSRLPPRVGPSRGCTPCATACRYSNCAPPTVCCWPFCVTSTPTTPAPCAGTTQCSAAAPRHAAAAKLRLKRHATGRAREMACAARRCSSRRRHR